MTGPDTWKEIPILCDPPAVGTSSAGLLKLQPPISARKLRSTVAAIASIRLMRRSSVPIASRRDIDVQLPPHLSRFSARTDIPDHGMLRRSQLRVDAIWPMR